MTRMFPRTFSRIFLRWINNVLINFSEVRQNFSQSFYKILSKCLRNFEEIDVLSKIRIFRLCSPEFLPFFPAIYPKFIKILPSVLWNFTESLRNQIHFTFLPSSFNIFSKLPSMLHNLSLIFLKIFENYTENTTLKVP